ncbi:MAG: acetylhydrolase, partial [Acidobacteriia bacterium]|nr:acetylhydrolase [Terriglobia bacterium]
MNSRRHSPRARRHRAALSLGLGIALVLSVAAAPANQNVLPYKPEAGPYRVEFVRYDWHDARRDRNVPVKLYFPASGDGPFPVIVFSHGLGGTREDYAYLGRHWASHGYVAVHLQHLGSDDAVWRGSPDPMESLRRAVRDPAAAIHRPLDVSFAIDQLERLQAEDSPLRGRLDLEQIGVAGHSFGAFTTLAVAGMVLALPGEERTMRDPRVKAAIPMSAPVPERREHLGRMYGAIAIPCLHITGTLDYSPITPQTRPEDHQLPFEHSRGPDKYLLVFEGGDHMVFSGVRRRQAARADVELDPVFHSLIRQAT